MGTTLADRRASRRVALVAAGIALLGDPARPGVSVRAVCRLAGLTERYFYEGFADRDEFVRAVYDEVGARAHAALSAAAGSPRGAVEAFVDVVVGEPAAGRVLLVAPLTEQALSGRGQELVPAFVALVRARLPTDDEVERQMVALGVVGALTAVFIAYLDGTLVVSRERLVEHCVGLVTAAVRG
ncbi:TetR/AcrR family transcriptional regulator [Actinokineospora pegani]|uniref:TetR/AcrR family transcriptional regulator n=1 Tax=Actinokineospora pegani TaxID=2654637 RepID=UPI001F1B5170|nr:TetR/AcrR family transcriptional regulator [Actinokineospora pegani]